MNKRTHYHWVLKSLFGLLMLAVLNLPALAESLKAQINRSKITVGETVVLSIDLPQKSDIQPDLSPLQKDFAVLGTGSSSQVQIINGVRSDKRQLNITLQALKQGELTIPPLTLGQKKTAPLKLTVSAVPSVKSTKAGSQVWLELETSLKKHSVFVQQEVPLTVRLYSAIPLNNVSLTTPNAQNAIVEKLGKDTQYQTEKNGQKYQVIEQHYVLYPEKVGDLSISPVMLSATTPDPNQRQRNRGFGSGVFDDPFFRGGFGNSSMQDLFNDSFFGGGGKRVSLQSNPIRLSVESIPAAAKGKSWLPAHSVSLTDSWINSLPSLTTGEPVSLSITVKADGLTGSQIPAIAFSSVTGKFRVYNESIDTENFTDGTHLIGTSIQNFTLIPEASGELQLPEIKLDWWNIDTNTLQTAKLPARTVNVAIGTGKTPTQATTVNPKTSADLAINQPKNGQTTFAGNTQNAGTQQNKSQALYWLAGLFLLALLLWATQWLLKRRHMEQLGLKTYPVSRTNVQKNGVTQKANTQKKQQPPSNKVQLEATKKAFFEACGSNDAEASAKQLIQWARQSWHDDSIVSLLDIAAKVDHGLDEINELYRYLYQSRGQNLDNQLWQGDKLRKALSEGLTRKEKKSARKEGKQLPPLYPEE